MAASGLRGSRRRHRARIRATRWRLLTMRASARSAHRLQHRFAGPAIDLETGGLLIGAKRRTGLHARLAVELVLVESDPRQMTLHRLDVFGAQLRRGRPCCRERQRASHAVTEMADV